MNSLKQHIKKPIE